MIKGIGKQVVVLKNPKSTIIEEAIFILKENTEIKHRDLLKECENILKHNVSDKRKKKTILSDSFFKYSVMIFMALLCIFTVVLTINIL